MSGYDVYQCLKFLSGVDRSGGIGGRAEDDGTGGRRYGLLELCGSDFEVGVDLGGDLHDIGAGEFHHLDVGHPCGGGDDDIVAGSHEGEDCVAQGLLGAVGDNNLRGVEAEGVFARQFVCDGAAQRHVARYGAVEREVVIDGLFGCILDVGRGVEVGFAYREVDHVDAFGAEVGTFLRHGQSL